jgi:signal transduction histidine kinase
VVSTVVLMAAAMLAVGLGIQLLLDRAAQRDIAGVLHDRAGATVAVVDKASDGEVVAPPASLEPGVEVYDREGRLIAGSVEPDAADAAHRLARTDREQTVTAAGDETRLLAVPFTTSGGARGVVVASAETAPYERSELYALLATVGLGVLVVAASAVIALRVTHQALRPVALMTERASEWSEHDLEHRFGLGPPSNELAALGQILDRLLDRVASVILAEQRLTAELAHELRTPLTSIKGSADLALMRGVDDPLVRGELEQIAESAAAMAGVISTLLDISRDGVVQSTHRSCLAADVLGDAVVEATQNGPDGVALVVRADVSTARIAAPREVVARALQPIVDNAVQHAVSRVEVGAVDDADWVDLIITDDGPGIEPERRARLFDPGVSHRDGGAGLGLGIAKRVARSLGGDVTEGESGDDRPGLARLRGATFVVRLPRR